MLAPSQTLLCPLRHDPELWLCQAGDSWGGGAREPTGAHSPGVNGLEQCPTEDTSSCCGLSASLHVAESTPRSEHCALVLGPITPGLSLGLAPSLRARGPEHSWRPRCPAAPRCPPYHTCPEPWDQRRPTCLCPGAGRSARLNSSLRPSRVPLSNS